MSLREPTEKEIPPAGVLLGESRQRPSTCLCSFCFGLGRGFTFLKLEGVVTSLKEKGSVPGECSAPRNSSTPRNSAPRPQAAPGIPRADSAFARSEAVTKPSPCTGPQDAVSGRWDRGTAAAQDLGLETPPTACPIEGPACIGVRKRRRRTKM